MEHPEIRDRIFKNSDRVLYPRIKPFEIKARYGIPCFSKWQDDMISRYQKGSRAKSTMDAILGNTKTIFKINKKARDLLLSNKLHKVSPKCCQYLKKEPAKLFEKETGLKPIIGVRGNESKTRKAKYKSCFTHNGIFTPLYDLNDDLLNKIYKKYKIEIPNIYNYTSRTGCMGCPYGSYNHSTEKELKLLNGNQKNYVCNYFKESYEVLGINP